MKGFLSENSEYLRQCEQILLKVKEILAHPEEGGTARKGGVSASGPFREHRRYTPGDDLGRVDWNVFARTGDVFIKVFEKDKGSHLPVILDLSASMAFGGHPRWMSAIKITGAIIYTAIALSARVDVGIFWGGEREMIIKLRGGKDVRESWKLLEGLRPKGKGSISGGLSGLLGHRRGGIVYWISDFHPFDKNALDALVGRNWVIRGIMPVVPEDVSPRLPGITLLKGMEGEGEQTIRFTNELGALVEAYWEEEMERVEREFLSTGGGLFKVKKENMVEDLAVTLA